MLFVNKMHINQAQKEGPVLDSQAFDSRFLNTKLKFQTAD